MERDCRVLSGIAEIPYDSNDKRRLSHALCISHCTCTVIPIKLSAGFSRKTGQREPYVGGRESEKRHAERGKQGAGKRPKKWTVPIRRHLAAGENERGERCVLAVCHRARRQEARRYNKSGEGGVRVLGGGGHLMAAL